MQIFWNNIFKFPRFFISVLLGFLLTITNFILKSLKNWQQSLIIITSFIILFILLTETLKGMLQLN